MTIEEEEEEEFEGSLEGGQSGFGTDMFNRLIT